MNVNGCACGRRFYTRADLGDVEKLPKHDQPDGTLCRLPRAGTPATFPPNASPTDLEAAAHWPRYRTNEHQERTTMTYDPDPPTPDELREWESEDNLDELFERGAFDDTPDDRCECGDDGRNPWCPLHGHEDVISGAIERPEVRQALERELAQHAARDET